MKFQRAATQFVASAGLLAGTAIAACSSTDTPPAQVPPAPVGGNSTTGGTGGTSASGAAPGGTSSSGAGGAGACVGNQTLVNGVCMCPGYAPQLCTTSMKCTSPMKDPDNCGACDMKCAATSACSAGACTTPPTELADLMTGCGSINLQTDAAATKLYALSTMTGNLDSIALPAGGAPTSIVKSLVMAGAFTVDATNAYIVTGSSISRVPLAGGAATVMVTETAPIFDVFVAGTSLYYATGTGKAVKVVATTATAGVPAATVAATGESDGEAEGVAFAAGTVLFASGVAQNVEAYPITEGMPFDPLKLAKLGASQGGLMVGHRSVQTDGTNAYWVDGSTIKRAPFAGENHDQKGVATTEKGLVTAFAFNATNAYFASAMGDLEKSALLSTEPANNVWMARALGTVKSIVVDATSVYLSTDKCKILKAAL
jgi:hypothetical protein